jgi:glycosyltransferase involved in cell wall biosynthesis
VRAAGTTVAPVLNGLKIAVVLPAYNAATTLRRTVEEIDREIVDDLLLVDDASTDGTIEEADRLGLQTIVHPSNRGYGANQKTCYKAALEIGADVVVMVHPDYQYSPSLVPAMAAMITSGEYDFVLGSRILAQSAVAGGMPRYKFFSNRALTFFENVMLGQKLSEYHTGFRAYRADLLRALPYERNSDDFVFDNQMIAQAIVAGARIGEISCPTRYEEASSSISFRRSVDYGLGVVRTAVQCRRHSHGGGRYSYLDFEPYRSEQPADQGLRS